MKNRTKKATPRTRSYVDEAAEELDLDNDATKADLEDSGDHAAVEEEQDEAKTNPQDESDLAESKSDKSEDEDADDSWLEGLTPYEAQKAVEEDTKEIKAASDTDKDDDGTAEQRKNLEELYKSLEHVDEDIAAEVHGKLVEPVVSELRAEIRTLKEQYKLEQEAKRNNVLSNVNAAIQTKHPKAGKILQSQEFMDFVNKDNNRYATDTGFDILSRAYYAGDAGYVIEKIDEFVKSRGKPKPPVGAEPQQGGGQSGVSPKRKAKPMTDEEYLARRRKIKAAPRGTYPPNALAKLVEEYTNSRG